MSEQQPQPNTPPTVRPMRAIVSTGVIIALAVGVMLGFSALANHFTQSSRSANGQQNVSSNDQGVLLGGTPAPTFALTDQTGATVTLDSLKGRPTVLTFFDSVCPHTECSLMAQYINFTAQDLGANMDKVNWVALSVNPWHDTQQSVNAFLTNQQMKPRMSYLMGSIDQLQPLWDQFHMQSIEQSNGIVIHTTGIYVLDADARELVFLDEGFDPHVLSSDIQQVLKYGANAFDGQQGAQASKAITQTHSAGGVQITLTASPGQYGTYSFTVLLQDGGGVAVPNATVTADLTMPDMAMAPLNVTLKPIPPITTGAYRADGVLSMGGQWLAKISVTPQGASQPITTTFSFNATY